MLQGMSEVISRIGERKKQAKAISKALSISVLNQVVSSGTNFVFGIYLVRVLTPVEFGLYGIGFAINLFYAGIGNSLFLTQMVVNTPDKLQADRLFYAASMGKAVAVFCTVSILLALLTLPALGAVWPWFAQYAGYGFAVTASSVALLLKEFFVRHSYTARMEIWALAVNGTVAAVLVILLSVLQYKSIALTATGALWFYAACHLVAAAMGQILSRLPLLTVNRKQVLNDYREAWKEGRWALVTQQMFALRTQGPTFITAWIVGPAGVAYLNAARLLVTPATLLIPALSQVFMPRLAELRSSGRDRVVHAGMLFAGLLLAIAMSYSGIVLFFLEHIVTLIFGNKYHSIFGIVLGWSLVACLLSIREGGDQILQALKSFQSIMVINTYCALISIITVIIFLNLFGLLGAVYGLAIAEFFTAGSLWWVIRRVRAI